MSTLASIGINIIGNVGGLKQALSEAQGSLKSAADNMKAMGGALTAGVTLPIVAAGAAALKMSTDLNSGMANVASMGIASDRIIQLKGDVQDMAIAVGKSTTDLTGGLYQVESAFGDSADTAKILEINAKSAAGGLASTTEAINLTSAVTKGYGDTSAAAVQTVSDLALKTVALGQTTFPELAASMGQVVPIASNLGIAQQELFAVMATGTGVTGNAAAVATQMRGSMQALMAPTKDMNALFKEQGFASGEAMLKSLGYAGTMQAIVAAANSSGKPLQAYIGSIEGQTLALALAGPLADQYKTKLGEMGNAAGATDAAFAAQTTGINAAGFAMQQAQVKMEVFMQKIGDGLGPAVLAVTNALIPLGDQLLQLANAFAIAPPQTQMLIVGLAGIAAAAGPVLLALSGVASALAMLLSPIGLIVVAVVALGAAWATNFGGIQDITAQMWAQVQPIFQGLYDVLFLAQEPLGDWSSWWEAMAAVVGGNAATIIQDVTMMASDIGSAIASLIQGDMSAFSTAIDMLGKDFGLFVTDMSTMGGGVGTTISAISTAFTQMQTAWTQVVAFFAPSIANLTMAFAGLPASMAPVLPALQGLLAAVQNMWTAVQPLLLTIGQMFTAVFAVAGVASVNLFAGIIQNLGTIVTAVVNQMTLTINTIATIFREVGVLIQAIAAGDWTTAWNSVKNIVMAVGTQIVGTLDNLKTLATGIFSAIKTAIVGTLTSLGVDVAGALATLQAGWDSVWNSLSKAIEPVTTAIDGFKTKLDDFVKWVGSLGNPFAGWSFPSMPTLPFGIGGQQLGTSYFSGGMTMVGESGPELAILPRGTEIVPNRDARRALGGNITISLAGAVIRNETDIEMVAHRVLDLLSRGY